MPILNISHISKSYGSYKAVDDVSFTVERGSVYGVLGPNGAGKTSTIRMIMNILLPDEGNITLFDTAMNDTLKNRIGYLPEERGLYPKMKVLDMLVFLGELHLMPREEASQKALEWLRRLGLEEQKDKKVEELSKGMQQKVQIIGSLLHDPELIILDEPFSGLDPVNTNLIKDIILELKVSGKAIMLSTHMMETAEKLCDRVMMINHGRVVLQGALQPILMDHGKSSIQVEYSGDASFVSGLPMVETADIYGNYLEVRLKEGSSRNDFIGHLLNNIEVHSFKTMQSSLNEIFITLAGEKPNE
ncbi:MAG TPA: ATP-binding cassette domain-containing protein [Caldithrix abyssi]|uniref:ATP-binding cassette domain-containing protein n=1 Tax=Caldithrix abyssi TaxID=187145 RepID=A0A7V5RPB2_CALAY|nr:ATP-binding cassette domain-containing protein [Caldithrix abyssi]